MDSYLSLQPQCLKTTFFKREVTLRVSEIYGEVLLLHLSVSHVKQSLFMLLVVLLLWYFLLLECFVLKAFTVRFLCIVNFISFKEMF